MKEREGYEKWMADIRGTMTVNNNFFCTSFNEDEKKKGRKMYKYKCAYYKWYRFCVLAMIMMMMCSNVHICSEYLRMAIAHTLFFLPHHGFIGKEEAIAL